MDGKNFPVDYGIWFNDKDGVNVATRLKNHLEEEARSHTFKETYVSSVQPISRNVGSLTKRSIWSRREVVNYPFASNIDIDPLLHVLRKISPLIGDHLITDSSNINK